MSTPELRQWPKVPEHDNWYLVKLDTIVRASKTRLKRRDVHMWTSRENVEFEENYTSLDIQRVDPPWS